MKIPENITRTDVILAIQEYIIGRNGERNRAILYRRLIDGIKYEQIAEEFDMSDRRIKDIVYKGERIIFKHLPKK